MATVAFFPGDLIGFTAGLLITVLLLVLTLRAAKLPGTPLANIAFAVCALLWNGGGLGYAALAAIGTPRGSHALLAAQAVQLCGAAAFPLSILALWRPFALLDWQKRISRILRIAAFTSAAVLVILAWAAVILSARAELVLLQRLATYGAALLLVLGAAGSLRPASTPRAVLVPSLAIVAAVCGATLMVAQTRGGGVGVLSAGGHLVMLIVLCAFFLFARFRYADVFVRYSVRILLAGILSTVLAMGARDVFLARSSGRMATTPAMHVFGVTLLAGALIILFAFADAPISALVIRWIFRPPDYRAAARRLADRLRSSQDELAVHATAEDLLRTSLDLLDARLLPLDALPLSRACAEGEILELGPDDPLHGTLPGANFELAVPVATGSHVSHLLLVAPGPVRPALVTHDLNFLRLAASQCGSRLDALRFEREAIARQSRESLLLQQVTEAELRALRSQVNPHFLFNSLNTIADLIVRNPGAAEAMTLRLAEVFRHVLANSSSTLTSVREEIEFLRTYLHIEEARFGERLQVAIDMAPEVAAERIPSLILQPLVENALKHGLGPKPGTGHLWISAQAHSDQVRLNVEDDGVGPAPARGRRAVAGGVGLANVAERLRTLYQERACVHFEPREAGGSRVTLMIPRGETTLP